jgi:4-amino-4-deoxy-L-arabinose transferase-like glycosyltransferase
VPRIYIDEAWDASIGYELAQKGVLRQPFIHNFGGMEVYFVQPRVVLPIICAGVFKITGYSIVISRLPSLLFGVLAVIALYHVVEYFFGDKQSFFVCLATIINPWFWVTSRRCRPEIYYVAFALVFLWLLISYFRQQRAWTAFFVGIFAALASLSHPNGLLIVAAISISWIIWKEKPHLFKLILWALAGFILFFLPYAIYAFWASSQPSVSFFGQMHGGAIYGSMLAREMVRWKSFLRLPVGIPVALVVFAAWLSAWWKSTDEDKLAATIVIIYPLSLLPMSVDAMACYLVAVLPFFSILIVRFVFRMNKIDILNIGWIRYIFNPAVISIYIFSSLVPIILMLYFQRNADFNYVVDEVVKVVGPKSLVHAEPVFWVGHDRYIYGPYLQTYDEVKLKDAFQWAYSQSFDYAIRTSWVNGPSLGLHKLPNKMPAFRSYLVTDNLCKYFGTKVHEFYNEQYGPVEIYKLDWSTAWKWKLEKQKIK